MSAKFITVTVFAGVRILNASCIRDIWDAEENPNDKTKAQATIYLKPVNDEEKEDNDLCAVHVFETIEELSRMLKSARAAHVRDTPIKMI